MSTGCICWNLCQGCRRVVVFELEKFPERRRSPHFMRKKSNKTRHNCCRLVEGTDAYRSVWTRMLEPRQIRSSGPESKTNQVPSNKVRWYGIRIGPSQKIGHSLVSPRVKLDRQPVTELTMKFYFIENSIRSRKRFYALGQFYKWTRKKLLKTLT